jgi:hypothetical protein
LTDELEGFCKAKNLLLFPISREAFELEEFNVPFSNNQYLDSTSLQYKDENLSVDLLPPHLLSSLYSFQKEGIEFGIQKHG